MDWKKLIEELSRAGMSQADIGKAVGKSQAWVSAVAAGRYGDLKWADGEALRRLHGSITGAPPKPVPERAIPATRAVDRRTGSVDRRRKRQHEIDFTPPPAQAELGLDAGVPTDQSKEEA